MNDAEGCYDQIDNNFAILVLIFFDVPWIVATNLFCFFNKHVIKLKQTTVFLSQYASCRSSLSLQEGKMVYQD